MFLQLRDVKTTEELRAILGTDDYDFHFDCGYTKPTSQVEIADHDQVVKCIWLHFIFFVPHAELEQLKKVSVKLCRWNCWLYFIHVK